MESDILLDVAVVLKRFKMYPYFDMAHYVLMCMCVREESILYPTTGPVPFTRLHPLSSWIGSMMLCFAGGMLCNFLLGEPLLTPLQNNTALLTATGVWYFINYAPFDFVYKLCKYSPLKIVIAFLKEIHRTNKVNHGILFAMRNFPGSYILVCLFGTLKGSAPQQMRLFQRLVCGLWQPANTDILKPTAETKGCFLMSLLFLLDYKGFIHVPDEILYLAVTITFLFLRLLITYNIDPFAPFENLFCAIFMGGVIDSLKRAAIEPADSNGVAGAVPPGGRNNYKTKEKHKDE